MPSDYTSTATTVNLGKVSTLLDGDEVERDNLVKEAAPGATPKLTLALLHDNAVAMYAVRRRRVNGEVLGGTINGGAIPTALPGTKFFNTSGAAFAMYPEWPAGLVVNEITLRWQGASGHSGLPTMPKLTLKEIDSTGAAAVVSSANDGSANVAAYEAPHAIALTAMALTVDASKSYVILIEGESGANFVADAKALYIDY